MRIEPARANKRVIGAVYLSEEEVNLVRNNYIARLRGISNFEMIVQFGDLPIFVKSPKQLLDESILYVQSLTPEEFLNKIAIRYLFGPDGSNLSGWGLPEILPPKMVHLIEKDE
ncbi:MAG: hypothetical protein ACM3UU_08465 [Ignavibacteriales bacterium]